MASQSRELVLITGATGHIGSNVLTHLLQANYSVRVASRSLASAKRVATFPSIAPFASQLSYVEIADFLSPTAFNEAIKGVSYVVHLASPIPDAEHIGKDFDLDAEYLHPAVHGTTNILTAAQNTISVKRVIITSSVAILGPATPGKKLGPDDLASLPSREAMASSPWVAYPGSKIMAYQASEQFMHEHKPTFDLVHILPAYVQGRNEGVRSIAELSGKTSNGNITRFVLGQKSTGPDPADFVHVDDVAAVHVAALDRAKVRNGVRLIAANDSASGSYDAVIPIVEKLFPQEVKDGVLKLDGSANPMTKGYNASSTAEIMGAGWKWKDLEEMVESLVGQVVELRKKELKDAAA